MQIKDRFDAIEISRKNDEMRLFRKKMSYARGRWQRDDTGQAYASHGRFRLTIKQANERWFYRVSDLNGELPPVDSRPFPSEEETLHAAQSELDDRAGEPEMRPEY